MTVKLPTHRPGGAWGFENWVRLGSSGPRTIGCCEKVKRKNLTFQTADLNFTKANIDEGLLGMMRHCYYTAILYYCNKESEECVQRRNKKEVIILY